MGGLPVATGPLLWTIVVWRVLGFATTCLPAAYRYLLATRATRSYRERGLIEAAEERAILIWERARVLLAGGGGFAAIAALTSAAAVVRRRVLPLAGSVELPVGARG